MPTQTKENYLKAIYFLNRSSHKITLTALSNEMEVSPPTVYNMVKNLQENGWVNYEKNQPLSLTAQGHKIATLIIRKHRLTEMFLTNIMGFGWEEVHDIAEEMEHLGSEILFDRMDEMLGFPSSDPHGSPIPDKDGKITYPEYQKLSSIPLGDTVRIRATAQSSTEFLDYLNRKEIELGIELVVIAREPYDQSMTVKTHSQKEINLSHEATDNLLVELCAMDSN